MEATERHTLEAGIADRRSVVVVRDWRILFAAGGLLARHREPCPGPDVRRPGHRRAAPSEFGSNTARARVGGSPEARKASWNRRSVRPSSRSFSSPRKSRLRPAICRDPSTPAESGLWARRSPNIVASVFEIPSSASRAAVVPARSMRPR